MKTINKTLLTASLLVIYKTRLKSAAGALGGVVV
jgi:hypothetical protein